MSKYYAVRKGRQPGIYNSWDVCKEQIDGFSNAEYKSFKTLEEAKLYLENNMHYNKEETRLNYPNSYAFVDGSYNPNTKIYGFGGFLIHNNEKIILKGCGNNEEMSEMRNVAGEIYGSTYAVQKAIELGITDLTIYYDYLGIEKWATGEWKRNKIGTKQYYSYMSEAIKKMNIKFIHVKGHSGIDGNEEADKLAKESVGIN